jgi:hypothetical protein
MHFQTWLLIALGAIAASASIRSKILGVDPGLGKKKKKKKVDLVTAILKTSCLESIFVTAFAFNVTYEAMAVPTWVRWVARST